MNKRILFIGSNSFIAKNVIKVLSEYKYKIIKIPRQSVDLEKNNSITKLSKLIKDNDRIFFAAGRVPAKNKNMMLRNIKMIKNFSKAITNKKINHFYYLSSDAVYSDSMRRINEKSKTAPDNFHGLMHLKRESYIKKYFCNTKLTIFRPTLVFGEDDPHNGYGPNKFLRLAKQNKDIELFGLGEERRDHIYVKDLSQLICKCINKNLVGDYNLVTSRLYTFMGIAKIIQTKYKNLNIITSIRKGKMPHNGYRAFNNNKLNLISKDFKFKSIENWVKSL